jgi:hypothetical protein
LGRAALLLASTLLFTNSPAQQTQKQKVVPIVGRVLAYKASLAFGAGVGPQFATFIFGVEEDGGARLAPVKVAYAFFKSDGPPPDSFFDYSKRYELQAIRDPNCDENINHLSYEKNVDAEGKPLPPSYVLQFLDGAPRDVLKPDATLSCYTVYAGKYRVVSQDKDRVSRPSH